MRIQVYAKVLIFSFSSDIILRAIVWYWSIWNANFFVID